MNKFKIILFTLSILLSFATFEKVTAQNTDNLLEQVSESSNDTETTKSKDKKKDKDKDKTLKIDERFYINLLIDIVTIMIIVIFIYYRNYRNKEVFFTYFLFNIAIFLLTFLLNQVKISMGAAFGLFAVFSMLRYRTEGISVKDMTYLFIVIAIGLISAIQLEYYELGIVNGILVLSTLILDGNILFKHESCRKIDYEKIELIKPENYSDLIIDLRKRTGLNIHRVSVNKMDFLKDTASIYVYYYADKETNKTITETNF